MLHRSRHWVILIDVLASMEHNTTHSCNFLLSPTSASNWPLLSHTNESFADTRCMGRLVLLRWKFAPVLVIHDICFRHHYDCASLLLLLLTLFLLLLDR